jgi:hypothetical protein
MNTKQRYQMVVESNLSLATVAKWDKGETVNQVMADHLEKVAKKLGLLEKRGVKG